MTTTVTKIYKGTIELPKELSRKWKEKEVMILPFEDGIYIKEVIKPSLGKIRSKLLQFGKTISKKDLRSAIKSARRP